MLAEADRLQIAAPEPERCALCRRPLGARVEWHHGVPKSRGGRRTVAVHPICHRTIHASFTNAELERFGGGDLTALRDHAEIVRFLDWIADKPPDFHAPTRRKR
ncbi:HNH endonuclease [Stakelama marina]|uniref:HNH endonuclease n=1 Tax=Stakelama marina TaxID=2826939 RepID=A0A8T4IFG4_9SPHN|nr:HNH endonuclease [Stakelama marina]MBR0553201.1 HNH endonuclease [Stakelama marina]